ncbi:alpha/beta fold hydrolase [uncultured Roseobacter sp.]|uniref:alpha/beta hydrolase n=1 Tax=uncultured Roseobacter sp. TaxID=114847 RepID=UPI0026210C8E|nr:alpha/beta fold hydrolase [uncultured Roseobacter sp.]
MAGLKKYDFWLAVAAALLVLLSVWQLEQQRAGITVKRIETGAGPVTLYHAGGRAVGPPVVVAHGFAGSTTLMQTISLDLARAGFTVAAFDFHGHGRSRPLMSADITRIEGTTRQLVAQTAEVLDWLRGHTGLTGPAGFVGHSMATDVIIRAAENTPDASSIVAISMYSDAVTETAPGALLMISGAWEHRLRAVALGYLAQTDPQAVEGQTVRRGDLMRRAVAAPGTEHLSVLFSTTTLRETRDWLAATLGHTPDGRSVVTSPWILVLLVSLVMLLRPLSRVLPAGQIEGTPLNPGRYLGIQVAAGSAGFVAASFGAGSVAGIAAFQGLAVFLCVWGAVCLALLYKSGRRFRAPSPAGTALLLFWGLGVFALALDRYGAAFVPVGPRLPLMAVLCLGTLPFMLADRMLHHNAPLWQRITGRVAPVGVLALLMSTGTGQMGLLFTVLPVLLLFWLVYGTMGHWISRRAGPETAGIALGLCFAWAIAASTPLFAG